MGDMFGSKPNPNTAQQGVQMAQQLAPQQQQYNAGAQASSNYNMYNPYGSTTFQQTGVGPNGMPTYSSNVSLNPQQQALLDQLTGTQRSAGGQAGALLGGANYGAQDPSSVIGNMTSGTTGELMKKQVDYYKPFFDYQTAQADTALRNQGFKPGDPAYDAQMRNVSGNQNLAVTQAAAQFEPQAFNQATTMYGIPAALGMQLANFGAPGNAIAQNVSGAAAQPVNLLGAAQGFGQNFNDQYKNQMQQYSDMMKGIGGIGSGIAGAMGQSGLMSSLMSAAPLALASDRRGKRDIRRIGTWGNGLPVYEFRYLHDDQLRTGLMADEVEQLHPEAVKVINGWKFVDYGLALA